MSAACRWLVTAAVPSLLSARLVAPRPLRPHEGGKGGGVSLMEARVSSWVAKPRGRRGPGCRTCMRRGLESFCHYFLCCIIASEDPTRPTRLQSPSPETLFASHLDTRTSLNCELKVFGPRSAPPGRPAAGTSTVGWPPLPPRLTARRALKQRRLPPGSLRRRISHAQGQAAAGLARHGPQRRAPVRGAGRHTFHAVPVRNQVTPSE